MGKITIFTETTKEPLELIGRMAGECWGAPTGEKQKNINRAIECLDNNHGRTLEFPQVYIKLEGYSARVIRELYTHIGGAPTRLQASTRYIDYGNFKYITPPRIAADEHYKEHYEYCMYQISEMMKDLIAWGAPQEDVANLLPLGMETTVVLRTNLRNLIDMAEQRLCSRAYWEFRQLFQDLIDALCEYSEDWAFIATNYFKPKCDKLGYCPEKYTCKRKPKKQ
jgi:thymidylate synthase (FAD)